MRLVLSSNAAPHLRLDELVEAARIRGFTGLELVAGHAHGVVPATAEEASRKVIREGLFISGYRVEDAEEVGREELIYLSAVLDAPVVVPGVPAEADWLRGMAAGYARAGGRLLLVHGTDETAAAVLRRIVEDAPHGTLQLQWEVAPDRDALHDPAAVLRAAGSALRSIHLLGGGPEAASQEGKGVGGLMQALVLGRYDLPLVLSPSTPAFRRAWAAWLGRRGGWGCGSKTGDSSLLTLSTQGDAA